MFVRHQPKDEQVKICCNHITLERVSEWKLLGVTIDENLTLNKHVSLLLKNCYSYLSILPYASNW